MPSKLINRLSERQCFFIERMGGDVADYLTASPEVQLERAKDSVNADVYEFLKETARRQEALHGEMISLFGAPLSKYQRADDLYAMLEQIWSAVRAGCFSAELLGGGLIKIGDRTVLIGTAPIRRFNAYVSPVSGTKDLVMVFDDEIGIALSKLSRGLIHHFDLSEGKVSPLGDDQMISSGRSEPFFGCVASVLLSMLYEGDSREGILLRGSDAAASPTFHLSRLAVQYLLLHEVSHITLGHLEHRSCHARDPKDAGLEWGMDHQRELEADREALRLFLSHLRNVPDLLCGAAFALPLALFAAIDMMLLLTGVDDPERANFDALNYMTDTHPSSGFRLARLREEVAGLGNPELLAGFDFSAECLSLASQRVARMIRESGQFDDLAIHTRWNSAIAGIRRSGGSL